MLNSTARQVVEHGVAALLDAGAPPHGPGVFAVVRRGPQEAVDGQVEYVGVVAVKRLLAHLGPVEHLLDGGFLQRFGVQDLDQGRLQIGLGPLAAHVAHE